MAFYVTTLYYSVTINMKRQSVPIGDPYTPISVSLDLLAELTGRVIPVY